MAAYTIPETVCNRIIIIIIIIQHDKTAKTLKNTIINLREEELNCCDATYIEISTTYTSE